MSQGNAIMLVIRHCGAIMSMGTGIPVLATRAQVWNGHEPWDANLRIFLGNSL